MTATRADNPFESMFDGARRAMTGAVDGAVHGLTGKDAKDYAWDKDGDGKVDAGEFFAVVAGEMSGDVAKKAIADTDNILNAWRDAYFRDLPTELQHMLLDKVPRHQREAFMAAAASYGAMAVLCWSAISWTVASCGLFLAAASTAPTLPWFAAASRAKLVDAVVLPVKALAFANLLPVYHQTALRLEHRWFGAGGQAETPLRLSIAVVAVYTAVVSSVAAVTGLGARLARLVLAA